MSIFNEMLAIKRFREQQAELAFIRQRHRRAEAERESEQAEDRLDKFRKWARAREQSMYTELCDRVVRVREIENVLQEVADLRKNESDYESALQQADETLDQETEALSESRQTHMQTVRMSNKFVELANVHQDGVILMQNSKEDQELEEVASLVRERSDWDDNEDTA